MYREDEKTLTPEEKLERSRVRNRDHSRKSRQRKKALVEGMKKQVKGGRKRVFYPTVSGCLGEGGGFSRVGGG